MDQSRICPVHSAAFADRQGSYLAAAQLLADISDEFSGTGEPYFDALAASYKAQSLATLARACSRMPLPVVHQ